MGFGGGDGMNFKEIIEKNICPLCGADMNDYDIKFSPQGGFGGKKVGCGRCELFFYVNFTTRYEKDYEKHHITIGDVRISEVDPSLPSRLNVHRTNKMVVRKLYKSLVEMMKDRCGECKRYTGENFCKDEMDCWQWWNEEKKEAVG